MKSFLLATLLCCLGSCILLPTNWFSSTPEPQTTTEQPKDKVEDIIPKSSEEGIALIYFGFAIILSAGGVYILVKSGIRLPFMRQE